MGFVYLMTSIAKRHTVVRVKASCHIRPTNEMRVMKTPIFPTIMPTTALARPSVPMADIDREEVVQSIPADAAMQSIVGSLLTRLASSAYEQWMLRGVKGCLPLQGGALHRFRRSRFSLAVFFRWQPRQSVWRLSSPNPPPSFSGIM